jgi:hypothetical protein
MYKKGVASPGEGIPEREMPVRDRTTLPPRVLPTNEVRRCLAETSQLFKKRGAKAEPVFFGPRREPTGVMLSYERYLYMLERLDDLSIALEIRKRERDDDGTRLTIEELAQEHDIDLGQAGSD